MNRPRTWQTLDGSPTRIIAHRGASGRLPEHTLAGYELAARQGADVLEPDLLMSADGVLYARHDLGLARSTDVASRPGYAARREPRAGVQDWWIDRFAARELDELRAIQPFAARDRSHDGRHALPRFEAVLELRRRLELELGRTLPLYPEIKHPDVLREAGLDPVAAVVGALAARDLLGAQAPVWLQCFDHGVLRELHARTGNRCFALVESLPTTPAGLARLLSELAGFARGIAPGKRLLWDAQGRDTGLVALAHAHGLEVHAWTFRDDHPCTPFADAGSELAAAFRVGTDAVFCDFPDSGLAARAAFEG